jgi:hypothetical protein
MIGRPYCRWKGAVFTSTYDGHASGIADAGPWSLDVGGGDLWAYHKAKIQWLVQRASSADRVAVDRLLFKIELQEVTAWV